MKRRQSLRCWLLGVPAVKDDEFYSLDALLGQISAALAGRQSAQVLNLLSQVITLSTFYQPDFAYISAFIQIYQPFIGSTTTSMNEKFIAAIANFSIEWPGICYQLGPLLSYYEACDAFTGIEMAQLARLAASATLESKGSPFLDDWQMRIVRLVSVFYTFKKNDRHTMQNLARTFENCVLHAVGAQEGYARQYKYLRASRQCTGSLEGAGEILAPYEELAQEFFARALAGLKELKEVDLLVIHALYMPGLQVDVGSIVKELKGGSISHRVAACSLLTKMLRMDPGDRQLLDALQQGGVVQFCQEALSTDLYLESLLEAMQGADAELPM